MNFGTHFQMVNKDSWLLGKREVTSVESHSASIPHLLGWQLRQQIGQEQVGISDAK
jgi:hypothetical protein